MNIYNFAQSTLNKIVVFTQSDAQDDIYKSAPSPVILEERSDEEKMRAVFISVCPIAAMRWVPRSMRKELRRNYVVVED